MSHFYQLHGLWIESDEPLRNLNASNGERRGAADIQVVLHPQTPRPALFSELIWAAYPRGATNEAWYQISTAASALGSFYRVCYDDGKSSANYILHPSGDAVWVESDARQRDASVVGELVQVALHARVWGILLRLRGLLCLHGSVVVVDGKAIALLGASGAGKSTLAAGFVTRGCALVADDKVVIKVGANDFWAQPGVPQLRLFPDSLAAFELDAHARARVTPFEEKRFVPLNGARAEHRYQATPLPLRAMYILSPRDAALRELSLELLNPVAALKELLLQRFSSFDLPPAQAAIEYQHLAQLARQIPVRRAHRPDALADVPALVNMILDEARA